MAQLKDNKKPVWMWYYGDYEIHHNLKLCCRREERGFMWPAFWRLDDCWHSVRFKKAAYCKEGTTITAYGNGIGYLSVDDNRYPLGKTITLSEGEHVVRVSVAKTDGLPCAFVVGEPFTSGEGYMSDNQSSHYVPTDYRDCYDSLDCNPEIFPFEYEDIPAVEITETDGGRLYDFGKETFARLTVSLSSFDEDILFRYGKSKTEALDSMAYITDIVPKNTTQKSYTARGFRYLFFENPPSDLQVTASYEYLPLEYKGGFSCDNELVNRIYDTSVYTFHLNSREFFLDGIKRDRWVWSGDAYQSYLINYYLYFDNDIVRRTALALRGKDPVEMHINTIMDYSFYWVIALGDYIRYTGDTEFVKKIWDRLLTLLEFCKTRQNELGFVVGNDDDWTFIDWAPMDKTGAVAAEQILYIRALEVASACSEIIGRPNPEFAMQAKKLKELFDNYFWDEEKGAYIDSYESGNKNVTRHANLFAIIFDYVSKERRDSILKNVVYNDNVAPITTPYFKFYELDVLCKIGDRKTAYNEMISYYGRMIELGATSIWEEFDPKMDFPEHYAMYGDPYGKSLCHAWGASPVYLLGKYFLGVSPTDDGYATFICEPEVDVISNFSGTAPINGGCVKVELADRVLKVSVDRDGGTLLVKNKAYKLLKNETMAVDIS